MAESRLKRQSGRARLGRGESLMHGEFIIVATVLLGVKFGYQPLPEGGMQYLIQLEPQTLESLRNGVTAAESDVPPGVRDIRSYKITVGTGELPKILPPPTHKKVAAAAKGQPRTTGLPGGEPGKPSGPWTEPAPQDPFKPDASPPRVLPQEPAGKPLDAQPTVFTPPVASQLPAATEPPASSSAIPPASPKPWIPLALALVLLAASVTWNGYLVWLLYEARRRYRGLVDRPAGSG
jgi:hypothetical protein